MIYLTKCSQEIRLTFKRHFDNEITFSEVNVSNLGVMAPCSEIWTRFKCMENQMIMSLLSGYMRYVGLVNILKILNEGSGGLLSFHKCELDPWMCSCDAKFGGDVSGCQFCFHGRYIIMFDLS